MYCRYGNRTRGMAANAAQSAYPNLWRNLIGLWVPSAGIQGSMFFSGIPDLSNQGNHMEYTAGRPPYVAGRSGRSLSFTPANSEALTSQYSNDALSAVAAFTYMVWLNQTALDVIRGIFAKGAVRIETYSDGQLYIEFSGSIFGGFDYSTVVTAGKWFHLACVFDGTGATNPERLKVYVDGAPITLSYGGTIPAGTPTDTTNLIIGSYIGNLWDGKMDDMRLYTRALSAREVRLSMFLSPLTPRRKIVGKAAAVAAVGQPWHHYETMMAA